MGSAGVRLARDIQAVIFDMDGVLIDSEPLWQAAEIEVFGQVGVSLDAERCRETQGLRIDEMVRYWFVREPWSAATEMDVVVGVERAVSAAVRARGRALPGALTAPRAVRERGLRCGLASSSPMSIIRATLDRLGLGDVFESVHTASDHPRGKPHPAVYLAAAEALGVAPERCAAIEDSTNGLISCRAAGMYAIAVPEPSRRADPRFSIADARLASLEELPALLSDGGR
jgi:sugar-phosphatase